MRITALAAALASALCTAPALAQSEDSIVEHADSRDLRRDQQDEEEEKRYALAGGTRDFTVTVTLPFSYNSNIEGAPSGERDAFHANPSIELEWERNLGGAIVFALAGADQDLYSRFTANNGASLWGAFGILGDEAELGFEPYVEYAPVSIHESGFGSHLVTLHDLKFGLNKTFALGGSLGLTANAEFRRREATSANSEQNRVGGSIELSGDIAADLGWSVEQYVQGRFFTGGTNTGRNDFYLASRAALSWFPTSAIDVDFTVFFEHNDSNRPDREFSTWDIGPSVAFAFHF